MVDIMDVGIDMDESTLLQQYSSHTATTAATAATAAGSHSSSHS
jgi:hypothetical protein